MWKNREPCCNKGASGTLGRKLSVGWGQRMQLQNLNSRSVQFSSVTQSCPTLCDPMNRSIPGLPVQHHLSQNFLMLFNGNFILELLSVQFSSVAQSCPTLCDPMNHSMPGLSVHHQLPEFTLTHIHRVSDAIQPSHPLLSPSLLAPNRSQHQSLFQ